MISLVVPSYRFVIAPENISLRSESILTWGLPKARLFDIYRAARIKPIRFHLLLLILPLTTTIPTQQIGS
jgi:hypothetical protein